uniref:USP32 N-terminal domain-containing protein n=1 Tax=Ditylenchus dipsaci TaxID=166011 RepID=A0A915CP44_9BILA
MGNNRSTLLEAQIDELENFVSNDELARLETVWGARKFVSMEDFFCSIYSTSWCTRRSANTPLQEVLPWITQVDFQEFRDSNNHSNKSRSVYAKQ